MYQERASQCSVEKLRREFARFHVTNSPLFPNFKLEELFAEATSCRMIKKDNRRQIFYLQTPFHGYFLKYSRLIRKKDRRRHFLLPFRKWAEWRNLHRLLNMEIPAAKPVLRGVNRVSHPRTFFLLTEKVGGLPLEVTSSFGVKKMGEIAAVLHTYGIYHADLHPSNIILTPKGRACLIDVQEIFFLSWMPHWLRVLSLGKIFFNMCPFDGWRKWSSVFLDAYNQKVSDHIDIGELIKTARRYQRRKCRSRLKRCCETNAEFVVVKGSDINGYKRRNFSWSLQELQTAFQKGIILKAEHVTAHQDVCIKRHHKRFFHRDRCLTSWKMSRALELRGIKTPRALSYFMMMGNSFFLSELLNNSLPLNDYLSAISDERAKRKTLMKLAKWLRKFADTGVRQRDFKSNNVLCQNGDFFMVDLDSVRIRCLKKKNIILSLAQLNASVSNAITIKDRLRFFYYYFADEPLSRNQQREIYREIWKITLTKNVSSYGLDLSKLLKPLMRYQADS